MADNPSPFDPARILAHKFPETTSTYTERDVALYALGIGACCQEAVDPDELKYVYNENGQEYIKVLPTFSALFIHETMKTGLSLPGLSYDPKLLLHGQQYIELYKPLPSSGYLENKVSLAGLHDKGKAAILEIATTSYDKKSGQLLCMNRTTLFLRGAGGFSSSSHPFSYTNYPKDQGSVGKIPKTPPFTVYEDCTRPSQALLYRLSGDYNPLHSDPVVAKIAGLVSRSHLVCCYMVQFPMFKVLEANTSWIVYIGICCAGSN